MTELEKLQAGLPYDGHDPELRAWKQRAMRICHRLNAIDPDDTAQREQVTRELLGSAGSSPFLGPNFHCDYGLNIHVGDHFFANYNVTILDRATVTIGDHVLIAPNVTIAAVGHPLSPAGRRMFQGIAQPVTIGNDVWIGANAVILPGVHLGNNVVVAAGAVVTHDVPDNTLVAGIPARKLKDLESDV